MPRLSVLVPVRYRPLMARLAVRTALAMREDVEVVVSDNCDERLDLGITDPRLRLLRNDRVLSMPENWERVLRAARGEWVMLLSDKCRVVPAAPSRLVDLAREGFDVVTYSRSFLVQELSRDGGEDERSLWEGPGVLKIWSDKPHIVVERSSAQALSDWYVHPVYVNPTQPMLYNSLIRRDVVDAILARAPVFVGMAPDVASSLAILSATQRYLETTIPATIIQLPNSRLQDWSNGGALGLGGMDAQRFLEEFGNDLLARYRLPRTSAGVVMQTLLAFRDARPDAFSARPNVGWEEFAEFAAKEIEQFPSGRNRLQLRLFRASQREGLSPRAVARQAQGIMRVRWTRLLAMARRRFPGLYTLYRAARGLPPAPAPRAADDWPFGGERVRSLTEALDRASADGACLELHTPRQATGR